MAFGSRAEAQDLKDRFNIKLSLSGMYLTESQRPPPAPYMGEAYVASPFSLFYGELRAVIDGRRLPGKFDLHLDGRVRLSGNFDTLAASQQDKQGPIARGYWPGGREYDLRQAWVRRRGDKVDFALGRMVVAEADALKIDGARLWWRMGKHWDASLYAGAYPDPFSRSLTDNYLGFAFAGGLDTTYTYDKIWGAVSVNSAYLGGNNAGGPLPANILDLMNPAASVAGKPATETPRTWITWTDYVRLARWLDLFTDLVLDVSGAGGVQLTRLDALASARAGKHLTLRVGYDHLSSFAIEMWLTRLLASRLAANHVPGTIENNLIVARTGRDEVRGDLDVSFGKVSIYADGRLRRRAIVNPADDPQFTAAGTQTAGIAYDVTLGIRDRGSLGGLRPGLWGMYLGDYRSRSVILGISLGRSFWDERLGIDLSFLYASVTDSLVNSGPPCQGVQTTVLAVQNSCYGRRGGADYELGITLTAQPWTHWFGFLDYRLIADTSNGNIVEPAAGVTALPQPMVLTHVVLMRIEARY